MSDRTHKPRRVTGHSLPRLDGFGKVTGKTIYGMDFGISGMLHGAILRSPHAYAQIKGIDTSRAARYPGVHAVITETEIPSGSLGDVNPGDKAGEERDAVQEKPPTRYGDVVLDNTLLARDIVRYVGQPIALLAADTLEAAIAALRLIEVQYEPMTPVFEAEEAMRPDAPLVHENWESYKAPEGMGRKGNICSQSRIHKGNTEEAFSSADLIVERTYHTGIQHQGHTEPRVAVASVDGQDVLTIWTSTQLPFNIQNLVSGLLNRPTSSIRVIGKALGGGFGSKLLLGAEAFAAALSLAVDGRPVRVQITPGDDLQDGYPRHPSHTTLRAAVRKDGSITALEGRIILDTGAFSGSGPGLASVTTLVLCGPYNIPNLNVEGLAVYTNKANFGPMRAPSGPQSAFALECLIDEIADELGMDAVELRMKNIVNEGDLGPTGQLLTGVGMREALEKAASAIGWREESVPNRGKGIAISWWTTTGGSSGVFVKMNPDGTVLLKTGAVEIGTGAVTAGAAQILAEELGIDLEDIIVGEADTGNAPFDYGAQGSRVTVAVGQACINAAHDLRLQLLELASELLDVPVEALEIGEKTVYLIDNPLIQRSFAELAGYSNENRGGLIGKGTYIAPTTPYDESTTTNQFYPAFNSPSFHAHAVEVEVDPETYRVEVIRYVAAQDVGYAVNPGFIEGQIQGGAVQAIGFALSEEIVYGPDGKVLNPNLSDYKMPTIADVPRIEPIIVEAPSPHGPYGAKGVGEPSVLPGAPAIANAIARACGTRVRQLPITAERIWSESQKEG
jgi:CO/xanthine dehydrogenase Mo-binding subunit